MELESSISERPKIESGLGKERRAFFFDLLIWSNKMDCRARLFQCLSKGNRLPFRTVICL